MFAVYLLLTLSRLLLVSGNTSMVFMVLLTSVWSQSAVKTSDKLKCNLHHVWNHSYIMVVLFVWNCSFITSSWSPAGTAVCPSVKILQQTIYHGNRGKWRQVTTLPVSRPVARSLDPPHTVPQEGQKRPALNSTNNCARKILLFFYFEKCIQNLRSKPF